MIFGKAEWDAIATAAGAAVALAVAIVALALEQRGRREQADDQAANSRAIEDLQRQQADALTRLAAVEEAREQRALADLQAGSRAQPAVVSAALSIPEGGGYYPITITNRGPGAVRLVGFELDPRVICMLGAEVIGTQVLEVSESHALYLAPDITIRYPIRLVLRWTDATGGNLREYQLTPA